MSESEKCLNKVVNMIDGHNYKAGLDACGVVSIFLKINECHVIMSIQMFIYFVVLSINFFFFYFFLYLISFKFDKQHISLISNELKVVFYYYYGLAAKNLKNTELAVENLEVCSKFNNLIIPCIYIIFSN